MNKGFISIPIIIAIVIVSLTSGLAVRHQILSKKKIELVTMNNLPNSNIEVIPIEHATMILKWNGKVIYTDPVGGASLFTGKPDPDIILLTDIHGDHLDSATLKEIVKEKTVIIVPKAVAEKLPVGLSGAVFILNNGEKISQQGFNLEAIPMYNLPESSGSFHVKGRGNGYVLEAEGKRVYISGDTADIKEMRELQNIDMAFVSMNLPYTMSVESAASGVIAFKPKQVYPYHYRGPDGLSDVHKFQALVNVSDPNIDVRLLNWYPKEN